MTRWRPCPSYSCRHLEPHSQEPMLPVLRKKLKLQNLLLNKETRCLPVFLDVGTTAPMVPKYDQVTYFSAVREKGRREEGREEQRRKKKEGREEGRRERGGLKEGRKKKIPFTLSSCSFSGNSFCLLLVYFNKFSLLSHVLVNSFCCLYYQLYLWISHSPPHKAFPVIHGKRQRNQKFKANLCYIVRTRLA